MKNMLTLTQLLNMVNRATRKQVDSMIYDFNRMGFYREDKRVRKEYIKECLIANYTTGLNMYGIIDSVSYEMMCSVLDAFNKF